MPAAGSGTRTMEDGELMNKSRLITTLLGLPLLVSALVSCTADVPDSASGPTGATGAGSAHPVKVALGISDSTPRFIHSNVGLQDAADQALLQGTLITGPGNCLGVKTVEGVVELPAFPGTTMLTEAAGQAPGIDIEGHKYQLGEKVKFAGGRAPVAEADRRKIAKCGSAAGESEIFFIQQISD